MLGNAFCQKEQSIFIRDLFPKGRCKWYEYQQVNHSLDYSAQKIVFPNISDTPCFAIDEGYLIDMTAFILPSNDLYLLSLLNSKLLFYLIHNIAVKRRGDYLEWKVQYVEKLPIRRINFNTSSNLRDAFSKMSKEMYSVFLKEDNVKSVLELIDECLSQEAEKSDVVYDLLKYLARQMIDMNKQKHLEISAFLSRLEKALKIQPDNKGNTGIDALIGKSSIKLYLGDYQKNEEALPFDSLMDIFHKNHSRIGISLSDNKMIPNLKSEYDKSLSILLPIKEKLKNTDWLIDQIVYRLYGLTEEEIKIVEEKD
jgi:hypothetical protein